MRSDLTKHTGGASWLGIKKASLKNVIDDSAKYDWADVYLSLEFEVADSKYTRPCQIKGSFETNPDGTIQDCPLLKRITYALDALGFQGGYYFSERIYWHRFASILTCTVIKTSFFWGD